jgi:hypothetical protein
MTTYDPTKHEYRRPDGTVLVRFLGDTSYIFPIGMTPVGRVDYWKDGEFVAAFDVDRETHEWKFLSEKMDATDPEPRHV